MMYPAPQAVTTIANAAGTRAGPYICPTTEGMVEKNPPLPNPLMIMNTTNGVSELDTGQMASMLKALTIIARDRLLMGPTRSLSWPKPTRPKAEERLNTARRVEPTLVEIPSEDA